MGHLPPEFKQAIHAGVESMIPEVEQRFGADNFKVSARLRKLLHKYVPRLMDEMDVQGVMVLTIILSRYCAAALEEATNATEAQLDAAMNPPTAKLIVPGVND